MFKTLFNRVEQEIVDPRFELYNEMRSSLTEYKEALEDYSLVRRDFDEGSPLVAHSLTVLEHYRTRYYDLRLKYEKDYGNFDIYVESVSNVSQWEKQAGVRLLLRPASKYFS